MNENLNPALSEEIVNDENVNNIAESQEEATIENSLPVGNTTLTKEEILEKLKNLADQKNVPSRQDVESLKQSFYKLRSEIVETEKAKFIEEGNNIEDFVASADPGEEVLKVFLQTIKEKRSHQLAEEEKTKEENYNKKLEIIEAIKKLSESSDDFNKLYKEFKDLQHEWNQITVLPQAKVKELWKSYQLHSEKFYDLIKINNEFRDYDFKKNLELKTALCDSVEKLLEETDIVSAFHQLQNFHNQWREIGPVSKEIREELWLRFKKASTEINKKYQAHFEGMKEQEESNLTLKKEICDTLKQIDYSTLTSFKEWDDKSKEIIELQAKWKSIGFVPRKINTQIFEEFRSLCDEFFEKKSEFFKKSKDGMVENLEKKKALCEQAIALKDSTDWRNTTNKLVEIQKEWKKIGPVPRKYSDSVWKEFVSACDYFFEQKKNNESKSKEDETANLTLKKEIIEQIKNISESLSPKEAIEKIQSLTEEWNKIGFVPFKEKDKIYKQFHKSLDEQYERLKIDKAERRFEDFKSAVLDNLSKTDNPKKALLKERDHLFYQYNKIKSDLQTYENNMSFLSLSSKGANSLLKDVNHKVDSLKKDLELIEKKVEAIDKSLKEIEK